MFVPIDQLVNDGSEQLSKGRKEAKGAGHHAQVARRPPKSRRGLGFAKPVGDSTAMLLDDALEVRKHDAVSIVVSDSKVAAESSLLQVNRLEPESAEPQRHKKFKPVDYG